MGAWGSGMRDSDQALDGIFAAEQALMKTVTPKQISIMFQAAKESDDEQGILGLAEFCTERGVNFHQKGFDEVKAMIYKALEHELSEERLNNWKSPSRRKKDLEVFQKELEKRR